MPIYHNLRYACLKLFNNKSHLGFILFLLVISLLGTNVNAAKSVHTSSLIGKSIPNFSLSNLRNQKIHNTAWQDKLILINFWATWCSPCIKEIPMLNEFQKQYSEDGLQVIGIAIDNAAAINQFTDKIPIQYPILLGNAQIILEFGNQAGTLPYTVIINQKGIIVEIASGMLTKTYLQRTIEKYR